MSSLQGSHFPANVQAFCKEKDCFFHCLPPGTCLTSACVPAFSPPVIQPASHPPACLPCRPALSYLNDGMPDLRTNPASRCLPAYQTNACLPQPLACHNSLPAATACLPQPLACRNRLPAATACLPQQLACRNSLPAATACLPQQLACRNR